MSGCDGGSGCHCNRCRQGHIVTNFHVVMNGSTTRVTLSDASTWDARLVGVAANKDIAVLKIDAPPHALTPLPVGSSEVRRRCTPAERRDSTSASRGGLAKEEGRCLVG